MFHRNEKCFCQRNHWWIVTHPDIHVSSICLWDFIPSLKKRTLPPIMSFVSEKLFYSLGWNCGWKRGAGCLVKDWFSNSLSADFLLSSHVLTRVSVLYLLVHITLIITSTELVNEARIYLPNIWIVYVKYVPPIFWIYYGKLPTYGLFWHVNVNN